MTNSPSLVSEFCHESTFKLIRHHNFMMLYFQSGQLGHSTNTLISLVEIRQGQVAIMSGSQAPVTNCECEYKIKLNTFLLFFSYVLHGQKSIFSIIL